MREEHSFGFVIAHREGDILRYLLVRQLTHWSFPKGHTEGDETPFETAKRELYEECGISFFNLIPDAQFVEEYVFDRNMEPTKKTNTFFLATVDSDEIHPQPAEILECAFVPYEKAKEMFTYLGQKNILDKVHQFLNK